MVEGHGTREEREDVFLGEVAVLLRRHETEQIVVVARQLGLPDGVRRGGAAKGAVEAGEVANLRRREVQEHARHAALRDVSEARTDA